MMLINKVQDQAKNNHQQQKNMSDTNNREPDKEQEVMREQFPPRKDNLQELKQREQAKHSNDDQEMREHFACTLIDPD